MVAKTKKSISAPAASTLLYSRVPEILESARSNVARTVNTTQVMANWLFGREIVEEERAGKKRAGYGKTLLGDAAELGRIKRKDPDATSSKFVEYVPYWA